MFAMERRIQAFLFLGNVGSLSSEPWGNHTGAFLCCLRPKCIFRPVPWRPTPPRDPVSISLNMNTFELINSKIEEIFVVTLDNLIIVKEREACRYYLRKRVFSLLKTGKECLSSFYHWRQKTSAKKKQA